jgi:hypothetical protein
MKNLILGLVILVSTLTFSQERRFEFESIDVRTEIGWDILPVQGEVIIYEDNKTHYISIITPSRNYKMYVKSHQIFIREYNFLYTLVDEDYNESSIRIALENRSWDYVDFYFYSDRPGEKYFRLCLKQCK